MPPPIAYANTNALSDDTPQLSITCPTTLTATLNPTSGTITIPTYNIANNGTCNVSLDNVSLSKSNSLIENNDTSTWNCTISTSSNANNETLTFTGDEQSISTNETLEPAQSKTISWNTTLQGIQAGKHIGEQLIKIKYTFTPIKTAYAVFSSDDRSLNFYKRYEKPNIGEIWNGKTVTSIYTDFENIEYKTIDYDDGDGIVEDADTSWFRAVTNCPWFNIKDDIKEVNIIDNGISPTSIRMWFYRCVNLENANLEKLETANITNASRLFLLCNSLESCTMPSFTSKLSNAADLISFCPHLQYADLSASDLSNVKSLFHFARNDSSIERIIFPTNSTMNLDNQALIGAFSNCSALKEINGLNNINVAKITDLSSTFGNCSSLSMLDLSSWNAPKVTNINYTFEGCESLTTIDVGFLAESPITSATGTFKNARKLENITNFNKLDFSQCVTFSSMFSECEKLTSLDTSNLNASSASNLHDMFFHCYSLSYLDLTEFSLASATDIGRLFDGCRNLVKVNGMNKWNLANVKNIHQMFYMCVSLQEIDMSSWSLTPQGTIQAVFYYCSNVRELDLSGWDITNMSPIDGTANPQWKIFDGCFKLEKVTFNSKWYWYDSNKYSLPAPSQNYIPNAGGLWYDLNTGIGYTPSEIPSYVKTTYVAVKP